MPANQCCVWDFVYWFPEEFTPEETTTIVQEWIAALKEIAKKWTFQLERGVKSKRLHFQGRLSLKVKKYYGWWEDDWEWKQTNWSVTSNPNRKNDFYACKKETREAGPWRDDDDIKFIQDEIARANASLFPWQKDIIDKIKIPEERIVNVLCSAKGNQGRSTFVALLDQYRLAMEVDIDSKSTPKDMMRQIMNYKKASTYVFDLPRSYPINEPTFWEAVEKIKKGKAWDDRYQHKKEWFPIPNVWIFTNDFPEVEHLSYDRWRFWIIEDGKLVSVKPRNDAIKKLKRRLEDEGEKTKSVKAA